ncbi:hypothetical protein SMICM17S_01010 [Streptomyces microflavus]
MRTPKATERSAIDFGERALALADDPGQQNVRVREALDASVQLERIEDEACFGMDIAANVDALGAEAALGEERISTRRDRGGHAVGGQTQPVPSGGGRTGASAGWIESWRHLGLGGRGVPLVGAGLRTCFGGGFGKLLAGHLAAGAVGPRGG